MRILFLNPTGQIGGAETSLLALVAGLRKLNPSWEFNLITGEEGPLLAKAVALGAKVEVLPFPLSLAGTGDSGLGGGAMWKRTVERAAMLRGGFASCGYARRLSAAIRRIQPGVIHTNGFKMHLLGSWAAPRKMPIVFHIHDYVSTRALSGRLLRASMKRSAALVANSNSVAADLAKTIPGAARIVPIYNAVDLGHFTPQGKEMDLDAACDLPPVLPGTIRVGLVATFARWKGHLTFLRALSLLPEHTKIRGYVIGGPIYRTSGSQYSFTEIRDEAARLGIAQRVGFTGIVEDPAGAIRALDIVVHASTAPEPFGMVIAEAMACGKALIVSNAGGAAEIFEDGITALGHAPGDALTLAGQIGRLSRNGELRTRLGVNARNAAENRFNPDRMADRFSTLYREVAAQPSPLGIACEPALQ